MKTYTIRNSFHNSSVRVCATAKTEEREGGFGGTESVIYLSAAQQRRVRQRLCGVGGCLCAAGALRIVRVIEVVDTREYEEVGDAWKPIPGSGIAHACARCGREHEVHALVELGDGTRAVFGTGCAAKTDATLAARFRGADARAKTVARLRAEHAGLGRKLAEYRRVAAEVAALDVPPVRERSATHPDGLAYGTKRWLECGREGRAIIPDFNPYVTHERVQCAIDGWRQARFVERGIAPNVTAHDFTSRLADVQKRLDRALRATP